MTQEEKRIKIAERCGWTNVHSNRPESVTGIKPFAMRILHRGEYIDSYSDVPDYFSDLNACHEMEKVFGDNKDLWKKYSDCLMRLTQDERIDIFYSDAVSARYRSSGANAFKRAEAFGKTLKLW